MLAKKVIKIVRWAQNVYSLILVKFMPLKRFVLKRFSQNILHTATVSSFDGIDVKHQTVVLHILRSTTNITPTTWHVEKPPIEPLKPADTCTWILPQWESSKLNTTIRRPAAPSGQKQSCPYVRCTCIMMAHIQYKSQMYSPFHGGAQWAEWGQCLGWCWHEGSACAGWKASFRGSSVCGEHPLWGSNGATTEERKIIKMKI